MTIWEELNIPIEKSGTCGANCTWAMADSAGVLVISGSGAMCTPWEKVWFPDYHDDYDYYLASPWGRTWGSSVLRRLIIEEGVTEIDENAFQHCTGLESVQLPETLRSVKGRAFEGCRSLKEIVLPNSLLLLESNSIQGCTELEHLHLGAQTKISGAANGIFSFCGKIRQITISAENPNYLLQEDILYTRGENGEPETLLWCSPVVTGTIRIPDTVHSIAKNAFSGCRELEELYIPASVVNFAKRITPLSKKLTVYVKRGSAADVQREIFTKMKNKVKYESGFFGFLNKPTNIS